MRKRLWLAASLSAPLSLAATMTATALAADRDWPTVTQTDKHFSETALTVQHGGKVRFINDDAVRHNIAVRKPSGEDDTGVVQEPGSSTTLAFDAQGQYLIHCLIHPRMKMSVQAE